MPKLTLPVSDSQLQSLQGELAQFVRLATTLSPDFVAPSLEEFAMAKLSGDSGLLAQESIRQAVSRVPKPLTQRAVEENTLFAIGGLLRMARIYGFAWVNGSDGSPADTEQNGRALAQRIAGELKIDTEYIPELANMVASAGISIRTAADHFQLPALKFTESLYDKAVLAYKCVVENSEPSLVDVLRWKILASSLEEYGAFPKGYMEQRLAHIKEIHPELFEPEPEDWIDKIAASLKKACGRKARFQETV